MIGEDIGIRIETRLEVGPAKAWDVSPGALMDQGILDYEMADLNGHLREHDTGLDGNGSFVGQVYRALCEVIETGKRKSLVLAYSEFSEMTIDVSPAAAQQNAY
jgi:hypothetical protein